MQSKNFTAPEHTGEIRANIEPGKQILKTTIRVDRPRLWWPWDLGRPNLYAVNINNIRIFGWHPPEIPEFYQYCNEAGLTVWQDVISLGTANISQDEAFVERIYQEAEAAIIERRNHPCLTLIEGGEEAFLRAADAELRYLWR